MAINYSGLFSSILGGVGAESSAQSILQGGQMAAQGALLSASGFRLNAKAVKKATKLNQQLDAINTSRQIRAQGRQLQRTIGSQLAAAAGTGLSVGSKSFLMLRNEATDIFSRAIIQTTVDAENAIRVQNFESQSKQVALENQARTAEFNSQVASISAAKQASSLRASSTINTFGEAFKLTSQKNGSILGK